MRGVAGGAILGVPLLYTQETWLHGRSVSPVVILARVIVVFGVNMAPSYFVGFRPGRTHRPTQDAVIGMGLSLLLLPPARPAGPVGPGTSPENTLGVTALTSIPVSIGFSVGVALASRRGGEKAEKVTAGGGDLLVASAGALPADTAGPPHAEVVSYTNP